MAILVQGSASTTGASVSSLSWSQACLGASRVLLVGVQWDNTQSISAVTYNGVALEPQTATVVNGGGAVRQTFVLVDPTSATNTVVVTFAGSVGWAAAQSISLSGVSQTAAVRLAWGTTGSFGGAPHTTATDSQSADLVVDCVVSQTAALTVDVSQTAQRQADNIQSAGFSGGMSTKVATGAGTTMSWTPGTVWAESAQAVVPAADAALVIQPPAGALVFKGPQSATSVDRWMAASGRLAWVGLAASVLLSVAIPSASALTFTGSAPVPVRGPSVVADLPAAAVTWHGLVPVPLVAGSAVQMGAGLLTWQGLTPTSTIVTYTIVPGAGSLVFKGPARPQEVPQPGLGLLVLAGQLPQAIVSTGGTSPTIGMPSGVLTWHGLLATVSNDRSINPGAGSLVLTGTYVAIAFLGPDTGTVVWQGLTPTVQSTAAVVLTPGLGSLVLHGIAPAVVKDQGPQIPVGSLLWQGLAPQSGQTSAVAPGAGSLLLTGQTPQSIRTIGPVPDVGRLVYAAQEVIVQLNMFQYPGAGLLAWIGYVAQPTVTAFDPQTALPGAGVLTLTGQTPTITATTTTEISPAAGSLVLAGTTSTLLINNAPQMPAGALVFSGQVPERSQISEIPQGVLVFTGGRVRSINSGDVGPLPPLASGTGMFFYQTQRRG